MYASREPCNQWPTFIGMSRIALGELPFGVALCCPLLVLLLCPRPINGRSLSGNPQKVVCKSYMASVMSHLFQTIQKSWAFLLVVNSSFNPCALWLHGQDTSVLDWLSWIAHTAKCYSDVICCVPKLSYHARFVYPTSFGKAAQIHDDLIRSSFYKLLGQVL